MSYTNNYEEFTEQYSTNWDEYDVNLEDCDDVTIESLEFSYGGFNDLTGTIDLPSDYDNIIVSKRKLQEVFDNNGHSEEAIREAVQCILRGGRMTLDCSDGVVGIVPVDTLTDDIIGYLEA